MSGMTIPLMEEDPALKEHCGSALWEDWRYLRIYRMQHYFSA